MLFPASHSKTLTVIGAAVVVLLVVISGLGCSSNSEPVSPAKLAPEEPADVSTNSGQPVIALEPIVVKEESLEQDKEAVDDSTEQADQLPPAVAVQEIAPQDESPKQDEPDEPDETTKQDETDKQSASEDKKYNDKYTDNQLNKNLTILMLAYQPDVRARQLLRFPREELTDDQQDDGLKLMLRNDYLFQRPVSYTHLTLPTKRIV